MTPARSEPDVVVLGLGAGGEHAAHKLAQAGLDVVGVERDLVGGECPFWGCTPSKLLVHAAHDLHRRIRGSRLEIFPGMGHDLPPGLYDIFVDAICAAASRAMGTRNADALT